MPIDMGKHKEAFLNEAKTHIKTLNYTLVELEKSPTETKLLQEIFKSTHTLKSLCATMGYKQMGNLCHAIEDLIDAIRNNMLSIEDCTDLFFHSFDRISASLTKLEANESELDSNSLIIQLKKLLNHKKTLTPKIPPPEVNSLPLNTYDETVERIRAIEVKVERLDILMNLAEELLVNKMKFDQIRELVEYPELAVAIETLGRLITDLQYHVMQVRLVPISFIFNRFLRMSRDLAKQQKKEINLQIEGGDLELDRTLIDEISESISHLIRNAIDHGIETPESRKKSNKPPQGRILLKASRTKETAIIEVNDDGAGLDWEVIKKSAIAHKLLKPEASKDEMKKALFSGLSTTKIVTTVSGRGLGLAIIKQKIESIGGNVRVESNAGIGTAFFMEIPLTLAIIKTLFVKVENETYAIPIEFVERLLVLNQDEFKGLLDQEAIIFEDNNIPIINLSELFNEKSAIANNKKSRKEKQPIVIIRNEHNRLGLSVDKLLSTQEVVIKPMNRTIKDNKYFSGTALIGSGEMVLVLDVTYLLHNMKQICIM